MSLCHAKKISRLRVIPIVGVRPARLLIPVVVVVLFFPLLFLSFLTFNTYYSPSQTFQFTSTADTLIFFGNSFYNFSSASFAENARLVVAGVRQINHQPEIPICSLQNHLLDELPFDCSFSFEVRAVQYKRKIDKVFGFIWHFSVAIDDISSVSFISLRLNNVTFSVPILSPTSHDLSICTPTIFNADLSRVATFINYYAQHHGVTSIISYVPSDFEDSHLSQVNNFLIKNSQVRVQFLRVPDAFFDSTHIFYYGQNFAVFDCLVRSMASKWVLFQDYDEFLVLNDAFTISNLTSRTEAVITIGSQLYSIDFCTKEPSSVPANRYPPDIMPISTDGGVECRKRDEYKQPTKCLDKWGRRKYMLQPKMTKAVFVHSATAMEGENSMDLDSRVGLFKHYRNYLNVDRTLCLHKFSDLLSV
ncbi:hypothetical protein RCL1_005699 [Eukaryota sp. TZLM3-RCL]